MYLSLCNNIDIDIDFSSFSSDSVLTNEQQAFLFLYHAIKLESLFKKDYLSERNSYNLLQECDITYYFKK